MPTTAATATSSPRTRVGPLPREASTKSRPRLAMRVAGSSGMGPPSLSAGNDLVGGVDDCQPALVLAGAALGHDAGADLDSRNLPATEEHERERTALVDERRLERGDAGDRLHTEP